MSNFQLERQILVNNIDAINRLLPANSSYRDNLNYLKLMLLRFQAPTRPPRTWTREDVSKIEKAVSDIEDESIGMQPHHLVRGDGRRSGRSKPRRICLTIHRKPKKLYIKI